MLRQPRLEGDDGAVRALEIAAIQAAAPRGGERLRERTCASFLAASEEDEIDARAERGRGAPAGSPERSALEVVADDEPLESERLAEQAADDAGREDGRRARTAVGGVRGIRDHHELDAVADRDAERQEPAVELPPRTQDRDGAIVRAAQRGPEAWEVLGGRSDAAGAEPARERAAEGGHDEAVAAVRARTEERSGRARHVEH